MKYTTASLSPDKNKDNNETAQYTHKAHFKPYSITITVKRTPAKQGKAYVPTGITAVSIIIAKLKAEINEHNAILIVFSLIPFFILTTQSATVTATIGTYERCANITNTARTVVSVISLIVSAVIIGLLSIHIFQSGTVLHIIGFHIAGS